MGCIIRLVALQKQHHQCNQESNKHCTTSSYIWIECNCPVAHRGDTHRSKVSGNYLLPRHGGTDESGVNPGLLNRERARYS